MKLVIELSYHGVGPLCRLQRLCNVRKSRVRGVQILLREFPEADACAEKIPNLEDHATSQACVLFYCVAAY